MKKALALILAAGMTFSLAACGDKTANTQTETNTQTEAGNTAETDLDYANMTEDDLISKIKDQTNVTAEEYIDLVSTFSNVTITEDMELEDNITKKAIQKLKDNGATFPEASEYIGTLLKSDAPQVRGYAIQQMSSILGVSDEDVSASKELLKNETEPYVICCALNTFGNEGANDPDIGEFLLNSAKNENSKVRELAAIAIGSSWNKGLDGAVDTMITLMSDSDKDVRSRAYGFSGSLGDEKIIEPIVSMLNNPEDYELHGNGIDSLNKLWYDFPFHENTSEAAYKAAMDYFRTTPRTHDIPSWTAISSLKNKNDRSYDQWRANATYFNADEFAQIMTDIIKDENASSFARTGAVEVIAAHCSKETFDSLATVVNGLTDKDAGDVQEKYQSQANELNK